jgi:hypothetical protein
VQSLGEGRFERAQKQKQKQKHRKSKPRSENRLVFGFLVRAKRLVQITISSSSTFFFI